jgi:hypothetical protein
MKKFIVKVQIPLFSTHKDVGVLVYNKSRSIIEELPLRSRKELKELLKNLDGEPKGYFYAIIEGKGLILIDKAPWQNW